MQQTPIHPFDSSFGATLKSMLELHGLPLLSNGEQLKGLLASRYPQDSREISVLLAALQQGVPQALLQPVGQELPLLRAAHLAQALSQGSAMAQEAAHWAVHTWQQGLGLTGSGQSGMQPVAVPALAMAPQSMALPTMSVPVVPAVPVATPVSRPAGHRHMALAAGAGVAVLAAVGGWFAFFQPKVEVTGVRTSQTPFIGDGKPQPVTLGFNARNAEVNAVEARFVRGDGQWTPQTQTQTISVDGSGRTQGDLSAGTLTQRATAPMSATFEYTLVTRDGKRSAPFEHTFKVVPPVLITRANLSGVPRLNQPYSVQLAYRKGAGDIVSVTRRVVDTTVPWAQQEQTLPVTLNQAFGQYTFAMEAPTQPMRSTVEFEMVDSLGVKSDPVRLAVNVNMAPITSGPATVVSVVQTRSAGGGSSSGIGALAGAAVGGALGNKVGGGTGRTLATMFGAVGGAFAGNAIEHRVRAPAVSSAWETVVRFDDGNTRRIRHTHQPQWSAGQRVVVSGAGVIKG